MVARYKLLLAAMLQSREATANCFLLSLVDDVIEGKIGEICKQVIQTLGGMINYCDWGNIEKRRDETRRDETRRDEKRREEKRRET